LSVVVELEDRHKLTGHALLHPVWAPQSCEHSKNVEHCGSQSGTVVKYRRRSDGSAVIPDRYKDVRENDHGQRIEGRKAR
jgi:hypothetical protein